MKLNKKKEGNFKYNIVSEMKKYFGSDINRIAHAEKVTKYAEEILKEEDGDNLVVIASAILHDIGIKECERKYNSTNGQLQEKEGPPIAKNILLNLGFQDKIIEEVCKIIGSHHSPGEIDTLNFKILWDADWLVNLKDEVKRDKITSKLIDKLFTTSTGKKLARKIYL